MKKLILSSGNAHKVQEIKSILEEFDLEVVSKNEMGLSNFEVEEDGDTLEYNALKKARELSKLVEGIVIADDTGLFVDALKGAPGVYSARYAGEDCDYKANNKKLIEELEGVQEAERTARFRTVMAVIFEDGEEAMIEGVCEGKILTEAVGDAGFGYDPLFQPIGYDSTFAELGAEIKNKISHRAKALVNMKEYLKIHLEQIK